MDGGLLLDLSRMFEIKHNAMVGRHDEFGPSDVLVGKSIRIQQFETLAALVIVFICHAFPAGAEIEGNHLSAA